jgi:lipopolysaccharide transport system ATP-binding protein
MADKAIIVEGLSKKYSIGVRHRRFPTLRDSIARATQARINQARAMFRRRNEEEQNEGDLWALRDVSFDVEQGDVVGVIGRNGSGKSTLLKILSQITEPTEGFAEIAGRVGSLLEVGTGFHPELTGRENIFLNGAILGMCRNEIASKFDEIVNFAETEKFLDTPVKRYSTGMFMRLAFAVAAHLNPEILLVDEVLAVGDAQFQKKCLGKMGNVAKEGRTVLFVSHNMPAIQSLCTRCVFLQGGKLQVAGTLQEGIQMYHQGIRDESDIDTTSSEVAMLNLRVNGDATPTVYAGAPMEFEFDLTLNVQAPGLRLFVILENWQGTTVLHTVKNERELRELREPGKYSVSVRVSPMWLTPGMYSYHTKLICNGVDVKGRYLSEKALLSVDSDYDPEMAPGLLSPPVEWSCKTSSAELEVAVDRIK